MEKRRKVGAKWYEKIRQKTLCPSMIPNLSRPSSHASKLGSIQDLDWSSVSNSRPFSRFSSTNNSPNASFSFKKRRQSNIDIEEILSKHQIVRPRSVSLVKYDPLPAINSDSAKSYSEESDNTSLDPSSESIPRLSGNSSISTIEEHEIEHLPEESESENRTTDSLSPEDFSPPQLVRSRTFDVIETNLNNLPDIDNHDLVTESQNRNTNNDEADSEIHAHEELDIKPKIEVKINVDGLSLNTFLTQIEEEQSDTYSLVTHPSSPTRQVASEDLSQDEEEESDADITNNNSNSDLEEILSDNEKFLENQLFVKLPDSQPVDMNFNLDITLQEFLSSLQMLEWEDKGLRIVEEVEDKHLSEPLNRLHFSSSTQVYLVPNT